MQATWTRENLRHLTLLVRGGARPAVKVYESIGANFFLAPAPGWLNLGWWNGDGAEAEATEAPPRLVEMIARHLPQHGDILDVANGLGAQDEVIARVSQPRSLTALNLTLFQLRAGRGRLERARASAVCGDAVALPFADASFDGLISVEAAFHFPSRARFFAEARRVLRPGGVLTMSDVTAERMPRSPRTFVAGLAQLRLWGLRRRMLASAGEVAAQAEAAGFEDVRVELCAGRVIDPAMRWAAERIAHASGVPALHRWASRIAVRQVQALRREGLIQYALITARANS